jgi:hypothetical protein
MPWPYRCASCGSGDTQAGAHEITCLQCGRLTGQDGVPVPPLAQIHSQGHYEELLLWELALLKEQLAKENASALEEIILQTEAIDAEMPVENEDEDK